MKYNTIYERISFTLQNIMLVGNKKVDKSNIWEHLSNLSNFNTELKELGQKLNNNIPNGSASPTMNNNPNNKGTHR